ncbi:MAG: hypothetical protein M3164_05085 [Actinomycetota bacterium]|nr:hypothetical protein [Actinomycetota bacterium]
MERRRARSRRPRSEAASRLSAHNLGEAVSLLYRLHGDPKYRFSEVTGVLQRIEQGVEDRVYHIVRRSGEIVQVPESDVVKVKLLPISRTE